MWNYFLTHWHLIVAIVVMIYEGLANLIPTIKNWSIIAKIVELLKLISDNLNKRKVAK
jgi:Na+/melibiose symporter-like transporter